MATQILGHTQQGVQGMLSTEGRPGLLPLVIYAGSDLLEPRHVLEVATRCVGQYRVTISRKGWAVVSDRLAATVKRLRCVARGCCSAVVSPRPQHDFFRFFFLSYPVEKGPETNPGA